MAATRSRKSCANFSVGPGRVLMKIYIGVSSIHEEVKAPLRWGLRCGSLAVGYGRSDVGCRQACWSGDRR